MASSLPISPNYPNPIQLSQGGKKISLIQQGHRDNPHEKADRFGSGETFAEQQKCQHRAHDEQTMASAIKSIEWSSKYIENS
jgi:hypothetical protein